LFSTYILLESEDNLILLDQHAAHEKVLYEKLLKEDSLRDHSAVPSQQLLAPSVLALTASDTDFIEENREKFRELGFDFDQIGLREIAIRYAPSFLEEREVNSVFIDVAESLKFETDSSDDKYLLSLATAACKAAVKAHDRLDPTEVRALIDRLTELDHPFSCPHGRPIIVRYSKKSLEKEFKRIV
jgi:DNA mismatch repair protein MutL